MLSLSGNIAPPPMLIPVWFEETFPNPGKCTFDCCAVPHLAERVKLDLPKQILEFTITVSSNQLNQYRYSKQEKIVKEPVISSIKLVMI